MTDPNDSHSYLEVIRLSIALRLFVLTGKSWSVTLRDEHYDFQFLCECEGIKRLTRNMDLLDITPGKLENLPHFIMAVCGEILYSWIHAMRMFPV